MQEVIPRIYGLTASFTAPYIATLTGTLTADRIYTFPDAAITVAGINLAQTWTATQSFAAITASGQITSTVATGTAPFVVASTTVVGNLNVSRLLGATWAAPGSIGSGTPAAGAFTTIGASGQITSTVSTGTAPFVIASTTVVANLNASALGGATFAAPGAIGGGTPGSAAFTTVSATGAITSTLATGSAPLVVSSTTKVANLNVDYLNGATWAAPGAIGGMTPAAISCTSLTASGADASTNGIFAGATGKVRVRGYVDATFGAIIDGSNAAENAYVPMSINANPLRFLANGTLALSIASGGAATFVSSVEGPKVKLTPEGGVATLVVADEAIAVGSVCAIIQGGTANRVKLCPTSGNENDMPVGVAYSAAGAAGDSFWMVVSGRVGVLPDTGVTAAQGYILTTSATTAGLVAQAAAAPAAATHFKEIGHFINTGSGAGVITDAIVHFN